MNILSIAAMSAVLLGNALANECGVTESTSSQPDVIISEQKADVPSELSADASTPAEEMKNGQISIGDFDLKVLFLTLASGEHLSSNGDNYELRVLEVPLVRGTEKSKDENADSGNTFVDIPLVRFANLKIGELSDYDATFIEGPLMHFARVSDMNESQGLSLGKVGFFTMFDRLSGKNYQRPYSIDQPVEGNRWEIFRNPFIRILSGTEDENEQVFSFMASRATPDKSSDMRLALLETYTNQEDQYSGFRFGEVWIFDTFRKESDHTASKTAILDSALVSLFRTESNKHGETKTEFIKAPLFTRLIGYEKDDSGNGSLSLLRLPILGSAFEYKTESSASDLKLLFLPVF